MGCVIYGTEKVKFTFNYTDDNSAIVASSTDWEIGDTTVAGDDSTKLFTDVEATDTPTHQYTSSGVKTVNVATDFNDGWDNIYTTAETTLDIESLVYEVPVLTVTWEPLEPTVLEECTFTPVNDDTRDDNNMYGLISTIDIDYYDDGTIDEVAILADDTYVHTFDTKEQGIPIRTIATYNDGWEDQTTELLVHIDMTNIPPVADSTREDNGVCIPSYLWSASASTDQDDDDTTLTYEWWLYKNDDNDTPDDDSDDTWEEIDSGTDGTYEYPFQYEGDYKLVLRTTDEEGDWHEKVEEFPIVFDSCSSGSGTSGEGVVRLESDRFEMVSIPVNGVKVAEYFLDQIADITGLPAEDTIEFVKAYPSNTVSEKKYLPFVPGQTKTDSSLNFKLVEDDNGADAIVPFLVRTKVFADEDEVIEIPWNTDDAV